MVKNLVIYYSRKGENYVNGRIIYTFMEQYDFAGKRFPNSVSVDELKKWASEWV